MFKEKVGEALISALVQMLLERIASPKVVNYLLGKKDSDFDGLLKRLRMAASSLAAVLDDAEQRQIRNDPGVEAWLDDVQEAIFDADDLLDEIETEALRVKVEGGSSAGTAGVRERKKRRRFNFFYGSGSSSNGGGDVEGRAEKLVERLEDNLKQKDILGLRELNVEKEPWRRLPSTSLVEECEVYGRDDDRAKMTELLLSDDSGREKICVIPIVGMGGLGKTTLAQAVFNEDRVTRHFEVKAWVCVSEEFDVFRVTKTLLLSDDSSSLSYDSMDLNSLQVKLREKLARKKFLIVLDDVWNENYLDWETLRTPFKEGARGSKIIVSTRSNKVASIMGTVQSHQLDGLSDEACWKLFAKHASGIEDFTTNPVLVSIGREIVGRCKGLPLAVKTLGGLLRSMMDVREWERVSKSEIWELTDAQRNILPALKLSYHYLPSPLKRCFAYCSIFPKDYEINREELILLWMADNLLVDPNKSKRMEDVGDEYFNDLVSRSFLQQSRNTNDKSSFVIHDLLVDLARSVSKKYCFLSETSGSFDEFSITQARHFAYVPGECDANERFSSVFGATHLRTFLPIRSSLSCILSKKTLDDLFLKLRYLRSLSLSGYINIAQLPDSISDLRHLRYLNLSDTSISCLPESTCSLYNLQSLNLAHCRLLLKLPNNIHRLINLRYLDVCSSGLKELPESLSLLSNLHSLRLSYCRCLTKPPNDFHRLINLRKLEVQGSGLEGMPVRMSELKSIRSLSAFIVGKSIGAEIGELGALSDLGGTLLITNLQNVARPEDASEARLWDKRYLEGLELEWEYSSDTSVHDKDVLDYLIPGPALKTLVISSFRGTQLPSWLGHQSFCVLKKLYLMNCEHCPSLPPLGQLPSLKTLSVKGFDAVVRVGSEFYGSTSSRLEAFSSLEELEMIGMPNWKEWSTPDRDGEAFPKLRSLSVQYCDGLTGDLPGFLPSLIALNVLYCNQLASSFPRMENICELKLEMCPNLSSKTDPDVLESFTRLRSLTISGDFPLLRLSCLPAAMKTLMINGSMGLEFQLRQPSDSLETLGITCHNGSFTPSFTLNSFPNISKLYIEGCRNLESLWASSSESHRSLSTLEIANCRDLALFPTTAPPFPNLTSLSVSSCSELKFLSRQLQDLIPNLESLLISYCPSLESFSTSGLPSCLLRLCIGNCDELIASRIGWNTQRLACLTEFTIDSYARDDMETFPDEGLLPTSVTKIHIHNLVSLTTLENSRLRRLALLKQLAIHNCPNLEIMTEGRLPGSLLSLSISGCPLMQEKCRKEKGEYWDKIFRVNDIQIDGKVVTR